MVGKDIKMFRKDVEATALEIIKIVTETSLFLLVLKKEWQDKQ